VGGGAQSSLWTQILSDITQLEQGVLKHSHGAPYGAAFLAGLAIDAFPEKGGSIDMEWNHVQRVVTPDGSSRDIYQKNYEIYLSLYQKTFQDMHRIGAGIG
jgi:xylulokinase